MHGENVEGKNQWFFLFKNEKIENARLHTKDAKKEKKLSKKNVTENKMASKIPEQRNE